MKVHEVCSCGAMFDADDGGRVTSVRHDTVHEIPEYYGTEVEALVTRWRAFHRHIEEPIVTIRLDELRRRPFADEQSSSVREREGVIQIPESEES